MDPRGHPVGRVPRVAPCLIVAEGEGKAEGEPAARALAADDDRGPRVLAGQPAVGSQDVAQRRGERVLGREPVVGDKRPAACRLRQRVEQEGLALPTPPGDYAEGGTWFRVGGEGRQLAPLPRAREHPVRFGEVRGRRTRHSDSPGVDEGSYFLQLRSFRFRHAVPLTGQPHGQRWVLSQALAPHGR